MHNKNRNLKIGILIVSITTILFSISYAFINIRLHGEKKQVMNAGELSLELLEDNNNLTITNALPMYDEVGMIQEAFTFKLVNNSSVPLNYIVRLVDITTGEKLDTSIVKYGFTKDEEDTIDYLSNLNNSQIDSGVISSKQTINYSLRLWIDADVEDNDLIAGKSLSYKIEVEAGQMEGTERNLVLDSDGGSLGVTNKSVIIGETYGELPTPTKQGYNFLGWFNEKDEVIHEDSILDSFTEKLTAKWGVNQYTVTLNPNGGSVSPNNKQVNFNDAYGEMPTPTKGDSIFLGWYTEISGGERIENTSVMNMVNNHTLYAHWEDPYQDNSGASRPVLSDELIPVKIANNGTVTKANIYEEWYDYDKKIWANAVVLEDMKQEYAPGDVIPESNIESYFVWIPRYKYKIFNIGNYTGSTSLNANAPQTIEIEFESKDNPVSNGTAKDEWLSHPAFQAFDTNGFWVGKFESGYRGATTTAESQVSTANAAMLVIKPNVYSWRSMDVGNMFKTGFDYLREEESHMMKNTEWGAVAYLSHSKYGINAEVYINNNSGFLTGCGGNSASAAYIATCTNAYGSKSGGIYNQTTTGNISGIFDMSGGAYEYVMGYNANASVVGGGTTITSLYSDFFTNDKWNKYYDEYSSTSSTSYNSRILGDATGELGPFNSNHSSWYSDYASFVSPDSPWFCRGGVFSSNSTNTGIFFFSVNCARGNPVQTFRSVLTPKVGE